MTTPLRQPALFAPAVARPLAPALIAGGRTVTHGELAALVAERRADLPDAQDGRCLVLVELDRSVDSIVGYLATLAAGHAALVVPDACADSVLAQYRPEITCREGRFESTDGLVAAREIRPRHLLHPHLALLLSTSGSTGSPKLVRLSHENLRANADAISRVLGLTENDRGITALPLQYCYGLSVLHSHLRAGASLVVRDGSAVEPEFWAAVADHDVTNVPLVPHSATWALKEGMLDRALPNLRLLTQAGGRLAPADVRRLVQVCERGRRDFRVMYGQTEATARIAVQPEGLAGTSPDAVGVALPGLEVRLDHAVPEANSPDVGELVVRGASVMMGYAEHPDDLALGRMITELRTGDLATLDEHGVIRITGRRSGFVKIMGLRVDLARVEAALTELGHEVVVTGDDESIRVAVAPRGRRDWKISSQVRRSAATVSGLSPAAVHVAVTPLPLLANGKVDRLGADALVRAAHNENCENTRQAVDSSGGAVTVPMVAATLGDVLALDEIDPDKSFVEQGGDSLSHVPATARLTALLGDLPRDWHHRPVRDLATSHATAPRTLDTTVVVRALAVVMICASHTRVVDLAGGAHILLALAGWSAARFGLALPDAGRRWRATGRAVIGIGVPAACAAVAGMVLLDRYDWPNVFLLNWLFGSTVDSRVELWFIDALVFSLLLLTAALTVPTVARARERDAWRLYLLIMAIGLVPRFITQAVTERPIDGLPYTVFWLVAAGAALAHAQDFVRKMVTIALVAAGIATLFTDPYRALMVVAGVAVIAFVPQVRVPARATRLIVVLASASLYIYVFQFQLFQTIPNTGIGTVTALLKTLTGLAGGCLIWWLADPVVQRLRNLLPPTPPRKDS